jgi:hypothetical protein
MTALKFHFSLRLTSASISALSFIGLCHIGDIQARSCIYLDQVMSTGLRSAFSNLASYRTFSPESQGDGSMSEPTNHELHRQLAIAVEALRLAEKRATAGGSRWRLCMSSTIPWKRCFI